MDNKKPIIFGALGIVLILILLNVFGNSSKTTLAEHWGTTEILCLTNGHQNLSQHIHPVLTIAVDGQVEALPGNIGITENCMAEVHTHEPGGTIHIESVLPRSFTLGDFFSVWGESFEREGYTATVTANGEVVTNPSTLEFEDLQQITIAYTSGTSTPVTATTTATSTLGR